MKRVFGYVILGLLLITLLSYLSFAGTLYKTPSNTLVWEENFSDAVYLDSYNSYIGVWGGGSLRLNIPVLWAWDGPIVDITYSKTNSRLYFVGEINTYSYYSGAPFGGNANFRYDVFSYAYDTTGNPIWQFSVLSRTNSDLASVSFTDGDSRHPSVCSDEYGNLYVVYSDIVSGAWRIIVQKISNNGMVLWGSSSSDRIVANTYNYQAKPVYYNGSLFVAYYIGNNIRLRKINANTGNDVWDVQVNTSGGANYYPDIVLGPDNYLYVAWLNNTSGIYNVYAQKIDPSTGSRVTWGGNNNDKRINAYTSYGSQNYWYGATEETVAVDMDSNTNLYVAFKLYRPEYGAKVFVQKVRADFGNFARLWGDANNDIKVSANDYRADAYPDIVLSSDSVYVIWISHGATDNDYAMMQRLDKITGQRVWATDLNLGASGVAYHHARIASDGAFVYVYDSYSRRLTKVDKFGNILFSTYVMDRPYNTMATFRTKNLFNPSGSSGLVPINVRVSGFYSNLPTGAFVEYYISPETDYTGAATNYYLLYDGQSTNLSYQKGNIYLYIKLNNWSNAGTNNIVMTNLRVELLSYYFSDGMVGKLPSGSDKVGLLVLNSSSAGQSVDDYVYNDGVNSAQGFMYFVNGGNVSTNIRVRASMGNSYWSVKYYLCSWDGTKWVTNQDITSTITNTGFVTNLAPYAGGNSNIVTIKVFLTPSISLSSGDTFTVYGYADTQLPNGSWILSDVVSVRGIVSASKPDLYISTSLSSGYIGEGIYNSDGSDQTMYPLMDVGIEKVFFVKLKNVGGAENIVLSGTSGDGWWKVQYLTNGVDVTSSIVAGTFSVYLNSGQESSIPIEIRVSPTNSSIPNNTLFNITVKAKSSTDPSKEDVVKISARKVETKVEAIVRIHSSSWVGAGVFSTDYSQKVSNRIDNGITNIYEVSITNLSSWTENITIRAQHSNSLSSGWKVEYFFDSVDVTTSITNDGFVVSNLSPTNVGSNIIVRIISPSTYPVGANEIMGVYFRVFGEGDTNSLSKQDTVAIETKLISTKLDGIVASTRYGTNGYNVFTSNPLSQYLYSYTVSNDTYTIILSNPSPSDFEFNLRISNYSPVTWSIYVSNGSSDITHVVTNSSGWVSPVISSSGTLSISLAVHSTNYTTGFGANLGDTNRVDIFLTSPLNASVVDNLSLFVEKALPPDLLVKDTNESSYRGVGLFSTNASSVLQVVNQSYPNTFTGYRESLFRLKNHRPVPENIFVKVSEIGRLNDWEYLIYEYVGSDIDNPDYSNPSDWNDVTSTITNSGLTNSITNGSDKLYRVRINAAGTMNNDDYVYLRFYSLGVNTKFEDVGEVRVTYGVGIPDVYSLAGGVGFGVVNTNYSQVVTNHFDKALGDVITLVVSNKNNDISGSFVFKGDSNKDQWVIKYYSSNWVDITPQVIGSGYSFGVPPSGYDFINVKIYAIPGSTYTSGVTTNFDVQVFNDSGDIDTFRIVSVITDRGIPDIYLVGGAWSNVFESTISSQSTNILIGKGDTVTNEFVLANWRSTNENNKVFVNVPGGEFSTKVELYVGGSWSNYTASITNSSEDVILTLGTSVVTGRIIMSVPSNTSLTYGSIGDVYIALKSQGRLREDNARFRYTLADLGRPDIYTSGVGDDIYESGTPSLQIDISEIEKAITNIKYVYLGNDRDKGELMKVISFVPSETNFSTVFYYTTDGGVTWNDITSDITNTGKDIYINPLSSVTLKVVSYLSLQSTNGIDDEIDVSFRLYSFGGVSNDNFIVRYVVKDKNKPDLYTSTVGSNVFYPIVQYHTNLIEKGDIITQVVVIRNARSDSSADFILNANSGYGDWNVKYIFGSADVTSSVTSSEGLFISNIPPLGTTNLEVVMYLVSNSTYTLQSNYIVNIKLYSYTKLIRDELNIMWRVDDRGLPDLFFSDVGNNVYYPSVQTNYSKIEEGQFLTNYFYIQNDRVDKSENLTLLASFSTNTNWIYEFYIYDGTAWNSITSDLTNGGYVVSNVSPSSVVTGMVVVGLSNDSGISSATVNSVSFRLLSQGKLKSDSISWNVIVVKPRPDLAVLPITGESGIVGDNVYEVNYSTISSNSIGRSPILFVLPATYSVIIQNDDVVDDEYVIKAWGDFFVEGKWSVKVKDINDVDLTFFITNFGITNSVLATNSINYLVEVSMIDPKNIQIGESNVVYFGVVSLKNTNKVDYIKLVTTRIESDVYGKVIEKVSGKPLGGATIEVYEPKTGSLVKATNSSSDGSFYLKLTPTTYKFVVKLKGYIDNVFVVTIPEVKEYTMQDIGMLRFNLKTDVLDTHTFPNPVSSGGSLRVLVNVPERAEVKVYIMDLRGVVIKRLVNGTTMEAGQYSIDWDLRGDDGTVLKQGVYILVVNNGKETLLKKIMIK